MKKLFILLFTTATLHASAQVYISEGIHENTNKRSYSVLSNQENKELTKTLETYLSQYGKVNKVDKNTYRIQNLKGNTISSDLSYIDVVSKSGKNFEKLEFFFLNDANNALNNNELNTGKAEAFVQSFIDLTNTNLSTRLLSENLNLAEDELKDAEKEVKKLEKSISNNLKDQEKLGKKLDSSPDLIAKTLAEKEEIVSQLFSDSTLVQDEKTQKNLSKASQKKDKEVEKIEKSAKKAESTLSKKESELEELKAELESAKAKVKAQQAVLNANKSLGK